MKGWHKLMLTSTLSLCALVSSIYVSNAQKNVIIKKENVGVWDFASIDSAKVETLKKKTYPYEKNAITKEGINTYVTEQEESVIYDFQKWAGRPIYNVYFEAGKVGDTNNDEERNVVEVTNFSSPETEAVVDDDAGEYSDNYAVISNDPRKFIGYSLKTTKKSLLWNITYTNKFVRATMLHELTHDYIAQVVQELKYEGYHVDPAYSRLGSETPNSIFITEGIAEYCPTAMGELIQGEKEIPESIDDMFDETKKQDFFYKYSVHFLQDFMNALGFDYGIRTILSNAPPTNEEIMAPKIYFSRLKSPYKINND